MTDIGDDRTLKTYFKYLEDAYIIAAIESGTEKMKRIEDPEKIFLANSNQLYAFAAMHPNEGTLRETFFLSSLRPLHQVATTKNVDFLVDRKHYFEVGGKNKGSRQLKEHDEGYLAVDDIEHGAERRIPLWLFGFLY